MLKRVEYKYIVAIVGVFSIFMELLDTTIINVAIPTLQEEFDVSSPATIQWVITGYLLSLAVFIPVSGWAGDRFRVVESDAGPALVWFIALDTDGDASRFLQRVGRGLASISRPDYRQSLERITLGGHPAFRWVHAPEAWSGWSSLPTASVSR